MTTKWICVIFSLALSCLTVTSTRSYERFGEREPRDFHLRSARPCSSCPPDRPELLAGYESAYDFGLDYESGDDFDSKESKDHSTSGYTRYRPISYISDRLRGIDKYGVTRAETERVNRNYKNIYDESIRDRSWEVKSSKCQSPIVPRRQSHYHPTGLLKNLERTMLDDSSKTADFACPKNVQVVHRADVEPSASDEYQYRAPSYNFEQEDQPMRMNFPVTKPTPKRVPFIEKLLKRCTEEAKKNNLRDLYDLVQLRRANDRYDEPQQDQDETSCIRDFRNTEVVIDRQEQMIPPHPVTSSPIDNGPIIRYNRKTGPIYEKLEKILKPSKSVAKNYIQNKQKPCVISEISTRGRPALSSAQSVKTDRNVVAHVKESDRMIDESANKTNKRKIIAKDIVTYSSEREQAEAAETCTHEETPTSTDLIETHTSSPSTDINLESIEDLMEIPPTNDVDEEGCSDTTESSTRAPEDCQINSQ